MQPRIHSSWGQKLFNVAFFACIFWSLLAYLLYRCGRAVWAWAVARVDDRRRKPGAQVAGLSIAPQPPRRRLIR